ncbi:PAMP-induced secreted peptide 2 [Medicago truncatula]|uniref:Transmembrane protein, putative n=1 Tax=Medicago truncatula TaxID=3880 RepID=A0A072VQY5_MEDTR|nr:PAMP-induced secreted peptide 2 [Medicago truncatula]KEH44096.1 transmembrane protein, putative [Medicago truncatula]
MDTKLKSSITFLTLILLVSLLVSEARPLLSPLQGKEGVIGEVNGVFRTLKGAGPSPGVGHRFKKLQNLEGMKHSGPSSGGVGHKLDTVQVLGEIKHSGPSPGEGHK